MPNARLARSVQCRDCGVYDGQIHEFGCDIERCPICGHQLISCDCMYEFLGYHLDPSSKTLGLPVQIFRCGVKRSQELRWLKHLEEIGRIPWIWYPNVCAKCGIVDPPMFMVPDEEWKHYIEPAQRKKILCMECYLEIKLLIDTRGLSQCTSDSG